MPKSSRFGFNYLAQHQISKDILLNENFDRLDSLVWSTFIDIGVIDPPASANDGDAYILPSNAQGAWGGRTNQIALYRNTTTGWEFYPPKAGYCFYLGKKNAYYAFDGKSWFPIATASPAAGSYVMPANSPASPVGTGNGSVVPAAPTVSGVNTGGTTANQGAITTLNNLDMLGIKGYADENDRLLVNAKGAIFKNSDEVSVRISRGRSDKETSLAFLTGYTTIGKIGFLEDDYMHFSVSPDGKAFHDGLLIKPTDGQMIIQNSCYVKGGLQFEGHNQKLRDYDFGVWTPTIGSTQGSGATKSYKYQNGSFVQIGKLVFVNLFIQCDTLSGQGNVVISGLPKPVDTSVLFFSTAIMSGVSGLASGSLPNAIGMVDQTSKLYLFYTNNTGSNFMSPSNISPSFSIKASFTYMTTQA